MGLALVPATIAAVQGVPAAQSGLASGLLNTSRLVGGALGLAVLSTIASSRTSDAIASSVAPARALTEGYSVALELGAGLTLAGALLAVLMLSSRPAAQAAVEPDLAELEAEVEVLAA
jgi:hypothetical protein